MGINALIYEVKYLDVKTLKVLKIISTQKLQERADNNWKETSRLMSEKANTRKLQKGKTKKN